MDLSILNKLPRFMLHHKFYKGTSISTDETYSGAGVRDEDGPTDILNAKLISSQIEDTNWHRPILDLDLECELLPSSTPGKHHLYINKVIDFEELTKLVEVMVEIGLMNKGVLDQQIKRDKQLTLRVPWVKKGEELSYNDQQAIEDGTLDEKGKKPKWNHLMDW